MSQPNVSIEAELENLRAIAAQVGLIAPHFPKADAGHLQLMLMLGNMMGAVIACHKALITINNNMISLAEAKEDKRIIIP